MRNMKKAAVAGLIALVFSASHALAAHSVAVLAADAQPQAVAVVHVEATGSTVSEVGAQAHSHPFLRA